MIITTITTIKKITTTTITARIQYICRLRYCRHNGRKPWQSYGIIRGNNNNSNINNNNISTITTTESMDPCKKLFSKRKRIFRKIYSQYKSFSHWGLCCCYWALGLVIITTIITTTITTNITVINDNNNKKQ